MHKFMLSLYGHFIHWLEANMFACPFKKFLNIECPGCGMQRSAVALLKGNILASLQLYPATIPILALFLYIGLHLIYKFEHGATVIKYLYAGIAIVITLFYIYKIVNHKITA